MNELINKRDLQNFFFNSNIEIDLLNFFYAIVLSLILSFLVKITYIKVGKSLNDKSYFSDTFIPLALITTLVITVIKFSLALSLGLVGALSIVRFRAAIKEPEELTYLFLVIATGLGTGSGQIKIVTIGVLFALLVIFIYFKFFKGNNYELSELINIAVVISKNINEKEIDQIIQELKKISNEVNFVSMSKTSDETNINIDIRPKDFQELIKTTSLMENKHKDCKVIIARSNNLNL